jgi:hypothetical protein
MSLCVGYMSTATVHKFGVSLNGNLFQFLQRELCYLVVFINKNNADIFHANLAHLLIDFELVLLARRSERTTSMGAHTRG